MFIFGKCKLYFPVNVISQETWVTVPSSTLSHVLLYPQEVQVSLPESSWHSS